MLIIIIIMFLLLDFIVSCLYELFAAVCASDCNKLIMLSITCLPLLVIIHVCKHSFSFS